MVKTKVVLYYRVSTKDQQEALDTQKEALFRYANDNLFKVVGTFYDINSSQKIFDRDGLVDLLNFCINEDVDAVLITERDRLTRVTTHMGFLKVQLNREGVKLIAINDPVDEDDPTQRLITGIVDLFGEWEYYIRKVRTKRGWEKAKAEGKAIFRPPFGYRIKNGKLDVHPTQGIIVTKMFEYAEGNPDLRNIQVAMRRVTKINLTLRRIKYILTNPVYCGELHLDGEVFVQSHEPLISKELFCKVSRNFQ